MKAYKITGIFAATVLLAACGEKATNDADEATQEVAESTASEPINALDLVLAGDHRSDEERARDQFRNPKETLEFFGITADMNVVEIWPGGGWYTQVIAPYLKSGGGKYYAAGFSRTGASDRVIAALDKFQETYVDHPEIYGDIEMTVLGSGGEIAPPGSADAVLTFRNVHNWQSRGTAEEYFAEFYKALKPGGVLGVVEHRADGAELPDDGSSGYVHTDDVKALAAAAGFEFDRSSEVNANAADTKDHPFGVWTLPPVRRSSEVRGVDDPDFDRAKYDAIGESDRMTLMFRKPVAADGALFE
ncbi:MAG: class I SAM-dependent methyltransferase [Marinicaulis sp.]|nr:hypothetical protein [Marinicaulis sp.]NNL90360.1 class I SAM-dependent methyltransferase [Marinicaulis sp.]